MTKPRIFLIHGWSGSPRSDWFPWAIQALTQKGYDVIAPSMPDTDTPTISVWVAHLASLVGVIRKDDVFIGHSIGCQTILRFLEKSEGVASNVILVAPWFTLTNLESDEARQVADPWLKTLMNFSKIINKSKKFITIFSDNDSWVPYLENKSLFESNLSPEIITLHNKGHITGDEGSTELPELLNCI